MRIIHNLFLIFFLFHFSLQILITSTGNNIKAMIISNFINGSKKELFKVYHFLFEKKYELFSEEGIRRYNIFKKTLIFVQDITDEEFRSQYLRQDNFNLSKLGKPAKSSSAYDHGQTKINWVDSFGPAKNQGSCGSCWAFSLIGVLEANYNIKFGKSISFSEQQLIDCCEYTNGCKGSAPNIALQCVKESGIAFENEYIYMSGYTKIPGECKYPSLTKNFILESYEFCSTSICNRNIIQGMLARGPLVSLIDGYGGGLFKICFRYTRYAMF